MKKINKIFLGIVMITLITFMSSVSAINRYNVSINISGMYIEESGFGNYVEATFYGKISNTKVYSCPSSYSGYVILGDFNDGFWGYGNSVTFDNAITHSGNYPQYTVLYITICSHVGSTIKMAYNGYYQVLGSGSGTLNGNAYGNTVAHHNMRLVTDTARTLHDTWPLYNRIYSTTSQSITSGGGGPY